MNSRKLRRLLYLVRRHPAGRLLTYSPLRRRVRVSLGLDVVGEAGGRSPSSPSADPAKLDPAVHAA